MTSKSELKRLATTDPWAAERIYELEAFVDFILRQDRLRGYPTSTEWISIIEVAKNESKRTALAKIRGEK